MDWRGMKCLLVDKDKVVLQRYKAIELMESCDSMKVSVGMLIKETLEALDLWEDSSRNNPVFKE